jgi:hypothetical protein
MDERRAPAEPGIRVYGWQWGRDEDRRPGLPSVGIFLVIALYAGAFLTALALPGTIEGIQGRDLGQGWGTLFFGLAFFFVAAVRAWRGGGVGWQALYGSILVLIGGSQIAKPDLAAVAWPILLVVVGALLLVRGTGRG